MTDSRYTRNRRLDRRIPIASPARIYLGDGRMLEAQCIELSVSGMTLHADYVPGQSEMLRVEVASPGGPAAAPPLIAELQVKRCHSLGQGRYEIGGAIVRIVG